MGFDMKMLYGLTYSKRYTDVYRFLWETFFTSLMQRKKNWLQLPAVTCKMKIATKKWLQGNNDLIHSLHLKYETCMLWFNIGFQSQNVYQSSIVHLRLVSGNLYFLLYFATTSMTCSISHISTLFYGSPLVHSCYIWMTKKCSEDTTYDIHNRKTHEKMTWTSAHTKNQKMSFQWEDHFLCIYSHCIWKKVIKKVIWSSII